MLIVDLRYTGASKGKEGDSEKSLIMTENPPRKGTPALISGPQKQ